MKLKAVVDTLDGLDEKFHPLYTEKDGKFLLTGVEGIKTQADMDRVNRALAQEKEAFKKYKDKMAPFADYADDPDAIIAKLDRFDELEAASKGKIDETKLDEIVNARLKTKLTPLERDLAKAKADLVDRETRLADLTAKERRRIIHDAVRTSGTKTKILDTAMEDALMLAERVFEVLETGDIRTKDGVGVTPGASPDEWLSEIQPKRPHWWPASQGGGSRGSGGSGGAGWGKNPWSYEDWNMTEQGQILNADPARADRMAQAAGTTVGGRKPAPKK